MNNPHPIKPGDPILGSLPLPALATDEDGRVTDCNECFCTLVSLTRNAILGVDLAEILPFAASVSHRGMVEARFKPPIGRSRDVVARCSPLPAAGRIWLVEDVTAVRRAARAMTEKASHFARLADLTHEGLALHRKGVILDVNASLCRMLGYERDELVGQSYTLLVPPQYHEETARRVKRHSSQPYRLPILRRDGSLFTAEIVGRDLSYDGKDIRVAAIRDISDEIEADRARAERELMYRQMFETNLAVKLLIDPESGRIIDANQAATRFYGWSFDQLRAMRITEINALPPDEVKAEMARAKAEDRLYFRFRHRRASGDLRHVEVYSGPVTHEGRTLLHSIIHDVTDRETYQAELERKTEALERSNADLEQFAYVASHDLQEPLRTVVSYLQLLERRYKGRLDGEADDFIGFAVSGAKRMSLLIQDLLEYSRVETQGRELVPVDVARPLAAAIETLSMVIDDAGAVVTAGAMPRVMGDEIQLGRLFQNLIGNAVKYRDRGRQANIAVTAEPSADGQWLFRVQDNGIGIAPAYHDRIFMIFQRLHGPGEYEGTGIGLAVVKRIVVRHGGRIWVESAEGEGSAFLFTLPTADH